MRKPIGFWRLIWLRAKAFVYSSVLEILLTLIGLAVVSAGITFAGNAQESAQKRVDAKAKCFLENSEALAYRDRCRKISWQADCSDIAVAKFCERKFTQ